MNISSMQGVAIYVEESDEWQSFEFDAVEFWAKMSKPSLSVYKLV